MQHIFCYTFSFLLLAFIYFVANSHTDVHTISHRYLHLFSSMLIYACWCLCFQAVALLQVFCAFIYVFYLFIYLLAGGKLVSMAFSQQILDAKASKYLPAVITNGY